MLSNCKHCGQLFVRQKTEYCRACQAINDSYYFRMREYVKQNPRSTVMDIHRETGIPMSKVLELQKQDYAPFVK